MKRFSVEDPLYNHLGKDIKMKCDYTLTSKVIKAPFQNKSFVSTISGPPASGKTTFVLKLLQKASKKADNIYYRVFKDIIWVCPSSSRNSIQDDKNPLQYVNHIFDNMDYDVSDIISQNKKSYDDEGKNYSQLLIVDDCGSSLKHSTELLSELAMNHRHLNLSIIILTQYTVSLPKSIRAQVSLPIIFKPSNQDLDTIHKEYLLELSKNDFRHLMNFVFKEKHDFLIIDRSSNTYYKNLGKINFN